MSDVADFRDGVEDLLAQPVNRCRAILMREHSQQSMRQPPSPGHSFIT